MDEIKKIKKDLIAKFYKKGYSEREIHELFEKNTIHQLKVLTSLYETYSV